MPTMIPITAHITYSDVVARPALPFAWIIDARHRRDDSWSLTIACPLCGSVHHFGEPAGTDLDNIGPRRAGCSLSASYRPIMAPPEVVDAIVGRRGRCAARTSFGTRCRKSAASKVDVPWLCHVHEDKRRHESITSRFDYPLA